MRKMTSTTLRRCVLLVLFSAGLPLNAAAASAEGTRNGGASGLPTHFPYSVHSMMSNRTYLLQVDGMAGFLALLTTTASTSPCLLPGSYLSFLFSSGCLQM